MGAGVYVGRIGGLAVALGIGAAVFTGHGVASADTSGSSATSPGSAKTTTATTGSSDTKAPKKKKKSGTAQQPTTSTHPDTSKITGTAKTVQPDTRTPATTADRPRLTAATAAPLSAVTGRPVAATAGVTITTPPAPVEAVTTAISRVVGALLSPFAGSSPTAPAESPLSWIVMAVARLEVGRNTSPTSQTQPVATVTTSAALDPTPATEPTNVVAIPQTPLLTALGVQNLPIIGPLLFSPIVTAVNEIPIVSDLLHPIFGYPVQYGLPAGSPQPQDVKVVSFDGTEINVHFMPAEGLKAGQTAPTILEGPGLGEPGPTNLNGTPLDGIIQDNLGVVGIATLRDAGYNVVTWDPRGEYFSGGVLELDSPDYEARDVSSIISWVAQQPEAQLDGPNDPRMGMVGASYGGGIQLVTAATDPRVDAIVPTIAWNTLNDALYENGAYKSGWGTLLEAALLGTFARVNPAVLPAAIYGALTGKLTPAEQALLAERGPGGTPDLVKQITAPTLLFQGTVDTLFPLQQADANATDLIADGVPTKVVWFCGGHGVCTNDLLDGRDGVVIERDTLAWLDRYVKDQTSVSTGPQFEWVDQRGQYYSSNVYPVPTGTPIVASSTGGKLSLLPVLGGSGPLLGVVPIGGTTALNALDIVVPKVATTTYVVGAPQLSFTYSGTGEATHVYAQLVDDSTGMVLGNQVTPISITLDGQTHTVTDAPLEMVAATLKPGQQVTLQLVGSAADYETITSLGQLDVSSMTVTLPTADPSDVTVETVPA